MSILHWPPWPCPGVLVRNDFKEVEPRVDKLSRGCGLAGIGIDDILQYKPHATLRKLRNSWTVLSKIWARAVPLPLPSTRHHTFSFQPLNVWWMLVCVCALLFVYMHISACVLYPVFIHCVLLGSDPSAYWGHVTNACVGRSKQGLVYWFYA